MLKEVLYKALSKYILSIVICTHTVLWLNVEIAILKGSVCGSRLNNAN